MTCGNVAKCCDLLRGVVTGNCKAIVGGKGTTYSSSAYGYAMMRVETAGTAGYLTAG